MSAERPRRATCPPPPTVLIMFWARPGRGESNNRTAHRAVESTTANVRLSLFIRVFSACEVREPIRGNLRRGKGPRSKPGEALRHCEQSVRSMLSVGRGVKQWQETRKAGALGILHPSATETRL